VPHNRGSSPIKEALYHHLCRTENDDVLLLRAGLSSKKYYVKNGLFITRRRGGP
jgi:hypothetical protein